MPKNLDQKFCSHKKTLLADYLNIQNKGEFLAHVLVYEMAAIM